MELKRTKMITYNVHDRGRSARGVDRKFDCAALAAMINGPSIQEKVRHGDMLGYFGHWPRVKFGMPTQEGGILDGKAVSLPIAIRTVHLSADEQGNITHQAEFLDTHEGRMAASLYDSSTGGFSSAIDAVPRSSPSIPLDFHGFDYVLEPNYTGNRGHRAVLDSIGMEEMSQDDMLALLDAVAEESSHASAVMMKMFDALQAQHTLALQSLERLAEEHDMLVGRLASGTPMLDDAGKTHIVRKVPGPDFKSFLAKPRVELDESKLEPPPERANTPEAGLLRRHGIKA